MNEIPKLLLNTTIKFILENGITPDVVDAFKKLNGDDKDYILTVVLFKNTEYGEYLMHVNETMISEMLDFVSIIHTTMPPEQLKKYYSLLSNADRHLILTAIQTGKLPDDMLRPKVDDVPFDIMSQYIDSYEKFLKTFGRVELSREEAVQRFGEEVVRKAETDAMMSAEEGYSEGKSI